MKNREEGLLDKNEIHRKHMERVKMQEEAEKEALNYAKTIKGVDTTVYKKRKHKYKKHLSYVEQMLFDRMKLKTMRLYQFLIGIIGFIGLGVIFLSVYPNKSPLLRFIKSLAIGIDLVLVGCMLALTSVIGIIVFQHRHDKISDRIKEDGYTERILPEKKHSTTDYWM
ncbi:MAG: hypothetical protein FWF63_04200 [Fibromonadales bacterium]|nr:hypothetical protein [Fibromonadales bacterium]